jgi:hypothetical protein
MRIENTLTPHEPSKFKIVCDVCGSLSIKAADPLNASVSIQVECGRCGAIRGTLADLHDLAVGGRNTFEF